MIRRLLFCFLLIHSCLAKHIHPGYNKSSRRSRLQQKPEPGPGPGKKWLTLKGAEPLVIAQGGFPGLFPDSSMVGYTAAMAMGVPGTLKYCNLQLTKDNLGVCLADIKLNNCTDAATKFPKQQRRYNINGRDIDGWFPNDFTIDEIMKEIRLLQNIFSRASVFDSVYPPLAPDSVFGMDPKGVLWLNVQNDVFWSSNKLNAVRYIEDSWEYFVADYISSSEIGFLKAVGVSRTFDRTKTKLVFRFLTPVEVEPTSKETYGALINKLAMIKTFASGILVPKDYIWPVGKDGYLKPATTLVADAHKEGLAVYASGFASDVFSSYNYSYDPAAEYLQFVDNSQFAVDGVVTEYPGSASNAIACLAQVPNMGPKVANTLVISHNGASIDYPGCTDLAYKKAINDGADIIDCNVQMTKDGVAFCLDSADLLGKTNAAMAFMDRSTSIPEVQPKSGVFTFDVTWDEIKSVKPLIQNPFQSGGLLRNPKSKHAGKFLTLPEFLELAKKNSSSILIGIQHAAYLASKKGLDIISTVNGALKKTNLNPKQQVLIQSDDTSLLAKFKASSPSYKRVLLFSKVISDAPKPVIDDIKKYADAVNVGKKSIVQTSKIFFSTGSTKIIEKMHAANISVYVSGFSTESLSMMLDFYSDPYTELVSFLEEGVDGVITDNPKTASAFMRSPCVDPKSTAPFVFQPIKPGDYLAQVEPAVLPPAAAPIPPLQVRDVVDPPLPPVNAAARKDESDKNDEKSKSGLRKNDVDVVSMMLLLLIGWVLVIGC
ncbi:glycerophosphodiester phosphodiesterase GDPDL7-like [Rutidosis leptorrhynchoides]|uniref:glycerophosphodiester phosphodiesterase GDPDL7-like n=1 Tax=Rutidosis leptorrhynchoides TaxID=125765 RepID=UPI003A99CB6D